VDPSEIGSDFGAAYENGKVVQDRLLDGFCLSRAVRKDSQSPVMVKITNGHELTGLCQKMKGGDWPDDALLQKRFEREISILRHLDHPNIVRFVEALRSEDRWFVVTEALDGGDLMDRIRDVSHLSEGAGAAVAGQLLRGLGYMHSRSICHRDVRPENVFFTAAAPECTDVKLLGFAGARHFGVGERLSTKMGAPFYMAPEVIGGDYNHLCDVWSAGVVAYSSLTGYPPFFADTDEGILKKVSEGKFFFNAANWRDISEAPKNLIRMCLQHDPAKRCSAQQALALKWPGFNRP